MKYLTFFTLLLLVSCTNNVQEAVDVVLADKDAQNGTKELYVRLQNSSERGCLLGHQDDLAYGHSWCGEQGRSDVKDVVGDYPAIFGWDLADIEKGKETNLDSVPFADIRRYMIQVDSMGGANAVSWHFNNILTGDNAWDTSADVVSAILPGGEKHEEFCQWLDCFANFCGNLKRENGENVPLLFRPYHEGNGSWFWWGREHCTTEQYKALWHFTFDYLTKEKGLHNLIFCYSPNDIFTEDVLTERYPGNDYVDLIGTDVYQYGDDPVQAKADFTENINNQAQIVHRFAQENGKLWAITESGLESVPDSTWYTDVFDRVIPEQKPTYILFWRNAHNRPLHFYTPYPEHQTANNFNAFANKNYILTLKEFGD